MKILIC
ncbi:hypothetical protein D047_3478A, partial [Vibrio parahaemolyticus VPTS-2010_2]